MFTDKVTPPSGRIGGRLPYNDYQTVEAVCITYFVFVLYFVILFEITLNNVHQDLNVIINNHDAKILMTPFI